MKTFEDLEFKEHAISISAKEAIRLYPELELLKEQIGSTQAKIVFDNQRVLSIVFGKCFYSNGIDTYEVLEINHLNLEPIGHITKDEVTKVMKLMQEDISWSEIENEVYNEKQDN